MKPTIFATSVLLGVAVLSAQESPADNRGSVTTPAPGQQQPEAQQQPATGPAGGATGAGEARETHFAGTNAEAVSLEELAPGVRTALERGAVVAGGTLGTEVSRIQYGGESVVRSRVNLAGNQQGYVFVNNDGEIVKTQRQASVEELPLGVRRIVEQQQGASDTTVMLEEALGQTSYILRVERDNQPVRWMQIDASGNVVRTLAEPQAQPGE